MTIGILVMVLGMLLALAGWNYVMRPRWHHCRWCGCFWTDAASQAGDAPDVADEGLCCKCAYAHEHTFEIIGLEHLVKTMPDDQLAKPLAESRLAELKEVTK